MAYDGLGEGDMGQRPLNGEVGRGERKPFPARDGHQSGRNGGSAMGAVTEAFHTLCQPASTCFSA